MAEDGIESLLGNDKGSTEGEIGVAAADAVAMAVSMDAAKSNADVAEGVREYLEKQSQLVDLQLMHFDEERRLAIAAAKRKRLGDRLRIGTQLLVALVILAAIAGLFATFYDALTDRGVKIEAFAVPPRLSDQGMTGQVVAKKVLDRITELQRGSGTVRAANSFANNWGHDIKVEVPETGISIGVISHWIHDSVGRSTRARAYEDWGDLLRAKGDLAGAIAKYSDANRRGPHWADPLKSSGDTLSMQGQLHEALLKYDEALKYAPTWAALKAARDAAAKRSS
jgi:tetratricopeptide (TPR) repeat protein